MTPNMHMHCYLADCVRDFGPIYGFWLFSFERYNGLLENILQTIDLLRFNLCDVLSERQLF